MESQTLTVVILVAVALLAGVTVWALMRRQRSEQLKQRFGPEYERTLQTAGTLSEAEKALADRAARVDRFKLRPLSRDQADAFSREWKRVQATFVDDPDRAVGDADNLVTQVMAARGYPIEDFDRRAEDVSVDHPNVVENYRVGRALVLRRKRGEAGTEELRQAVVNYRALFDDLLEVEEVHHARRAS